MKPYKRALYVIDGVNRLTCPIPLKLNTYRGCTGGCAYCTASLQARMWRSRSGAGRPVPSPIEYTAKKFASETEGMEQSLIRQRIPVQMGVQTDPLQPAERREGATLAHLKLLADYNYPAIVITKFPDLITHSEYLKVASEMPFILQVSVSGLDGRIEPGCPSPQERLAAVRELVDAGIVCQVRLWPYIPMHTDLEATLGAIADTGCKDVIVSTLRMVNSRKWRERINSALDYDYFATVGLMGQHPFERSGSYLVIRPDVKYRMIQEAREMAEDLGLRFLTPADPTGEICGWQSCCGVERYKGFESVAEWSLYTNGHRFGSKPLRFDEYMHGFDCPWRVEFEGYWNRGDLEMLLQGLKFNASDKTYTRLM